MSKIKIVQEMHKQKKALPAFNVSTMEGLQAIFKKANELNYPVFIETSAGEAKHMGPKLLSDMCKSLAKIYETDYILHLDRGNDLNFMEKCLKAGYDSISAEFGRDLDFEENLKMSKKARELTNKYDAILEGVMEVVPIVYYKESMQKHMDITDPELAKKFIKEVNPDIFCVSIGTQSGGLKDIKEVKFDVLEKINSDSPNMPFILHGGSFLDKKVVKRCISLGVTKINVNSELRYAYANKLKENIKNNPEEYAPYRLLSGVKKEMEKVVENKIKLFDNL